MKPNIFSALVFLLGFFILINACKTQQEKRAADGIYSCPMHPEITGKKGGRCSKCKMALTESNAPAVFCCAIHKECTGKMGAKCPKCGTPLEEPVQPHCCPMHPEQKGKKGDHCPKCKMELEPQKPGKGMGRR